MNQHMKRELKDGLLKSNGCNWRGNTVAPYENENKTKNHLDTINEIIKAEEQIQKSNENIAKYEKRISQIKKSSTWRYSIVYRKLTGLLNKLFKRDANLSRKQRLKLLENENYQLKIEIENKKESLNKLELLDPELNKHDVHKILKGLKRDGVLFNYLEDLMESKEKQLKNINEALIYAARLYMKERPYKKDYIYKLIINHLKIEDIPEFMVRSGLTNEPIPLQVASFRGSLTLRMRQKQLTGYLPEWELDDKRKGYHFVSRFNIEFPKLSEGTYSIDQIPQIEGIVIKPVDGAGARGVYIVHDFHDIFDVKRSVHLHNWTELIQQMKVDLKLKAVENNEWMLEEIIYENRDDKKLAKDFKFYCFYGQVGLILEITREPEIRHCWWTSSMERVSVDKYNESLYDGTGVSEGDIKMVEKLSLSIPAPFIRIDFLQSENKLIFGEFTPKPGNYDEFSKEIDQLLGDFFLEAEANLMEDLRRGKKFPLFNELTQEN